MMEMTCDYKVEENMENARETLKKAFGRPNYIDKRDNQEKRTVKEWIEKYIIPDLKEYNDVVVRSDKGDTGLMHFLSEVYRMASQFGLNAKISSCNGEAIYSFWYPVGD